MPSRGESTYVPVMSAGRRSGVNWIRRNPQPSVRAKALTSVVFATPGTPSSSTWPRASRATRRSSGTAVEPTHTSAEVLSMGIDVILNRPSRSPHCNEMSTAENATASTPAEYRAFSCQSVCRA